MNTELTKILMTIGLESELVDKVADLIVELCYDLTNVAFQEGMLHATEIVVRTRNDQDAGYTPEEYEKKIKSILSKQLTGKDLKD